MTPPGEAEFKRDASHWLKKFTPEEWIRAAMGELHRAEQAYSARDARAGLAGARRAAGMGLNAALVCAPSEAYGRSYIDHLRALARDTGVPEAVREQAVFLMQEPEPSKHVVVLLSKSHDKRVLDAARDVLAHAYAVCVRHNALTAPHGIGETS